MTTEFLYKVEGMSDFLAKVIKHIGFSCITEHLTTVWVLSRRALCVMRGVPVEHTENITIASLGTICQRPKGFRALRELDRTTLTLEIDMALSVLEEWILACPPDEPLEAIVALTQETLADIQAIIEAQRVDNTFRSFLVQMIGDKKLYYIILYYIILYLLSIHSEPFKHI